MGSMKKSILPFVALLVAFPATPAGKFALTVDNIMRGHGLFGWEPTDVRWSGDGERIYFHWKQASDPLHKDPDTYVVTRDGSGLRKLPDEEARLAPPIVGDTSPDKKRTVYARDGDVFLYDGVTGQTRQLTKTSERETDPHFTRDGKRVSFTRGNNLFVLSLDSPAIEEMTDIRSAVAGEKKGTPSQEYLKKEEKELLEVVRERADKKEEVEAKQKRENPRKPFTLEAGQSIAWLDLTPDEKYVMAGVKEAAKGSKDTVVPNYLTESGYIENIPSRENVGDVQPHIRVALLNVQSGDVKWVDAGQAPEREIDLSPPVWSDDGTKAVLPARAADNKDRWILALDEVTGKTRVVAHDHDDAWIEGPGLSTLGWMKNGRDVYFQSERSGYSHLYTVPFGGGEAKALTAGPWEVESAELSRDKSRFFLITNEGDPGQQQVYQMSAEGGPRLRLTALAGGHSFVASPDDRWFADVYSYTNKPPELYVEETRPGAVARKLTSSPAPDFRTYPWLDVPIVTFPARDGVMLRARLYKPPNFRRGGPGIVFVHGAGYLQDVHRWWSYYAREYMFHQLLMQRGYIVIEVDYRGSAGYGRDWRTAIYEHMGGKDLDDNIDAARWLVSAQGADPKRLGIYGGSYGGFITLMAMFTQPDVFAAGAALRPVSDWAYYNNGYTSDILNVPQKDPDAYRRSSPIYFAQGLKGALLICHGMADTNVHFQDSVRLAERLIELRKQNWELAVYPAENHSFVEPASWADEYKRILKLFETNLQPRG
jgi:dipeptidyl aminopeptidase/acylaminoacyl peptidase